jgi:hypothetical protein
MNIASEKKLKPEAVPKLQCWNSLKLFIISYHRQKNQALSLLCHGEPQCGSYDEKDCGTLAGRRAVSKNRARSSAHRAGLGNPVLEPGLSRGNLDPVFYPQNRKFGPGGDSEPGGRIHHQDPFCTGG